MQAKILPEDFLESVRLDQRSRFIGGRLTILLLIIAIILFGLKTRQFMVADGPIVSVVLFGFAVVYLLSLVAVRSRFLLPRRARRIYEGQKSLSEPFTFEPEDEGIRFASALGSGVLPWSQISRWRETENLILIDHSEGMRNIIPKRTFDSLEALEAFKETLRTRIGPGNSVRSFGS